ncbi:MAG: 4-alpha-glucanotransferase [Bacteroidia bacterium]
MPGDRGCGILLHITSLPSDAGIGDFGPEAYKFVDFLYNAKIKYWQILPLNPTNTISGNSPYSSDSAYAGNILLISPDLLVVEGLLETKDLFYSDQLNFELIHENKLKQLDKAYETFKLNKILENDFAKFKNEHSYWLDDYAYYKIIKNKFKNVTWHQWSLEYKNREQSALNLISEQSHDELEKIKFYQFIFYRQWLKLKDFCTKRNISIIGDLPYYVAFDSVDVWTNPENFKLDENKSPLFISGVPPDYFSETGQLWGNPVYDWELMKSNNFDWWINRIGHNLKLVDLLRLDHFRAFSAYWEVVAGEETAINGQWIDVPGEEFFFALNTKFKELPVIAEDLGDIDEPVRNLIKSFDLPGMKVLQFAFDHKIKNSPDAPHNHNQNCIVYTGTHDNPTTLSWFQRLSSEDINKITNYTGVPVTENNIVNLFIRMAMMSVAGICIIPMQDFLNLGKEAIMNRPGTSEGNWEWRMEKNQISQQLANDIATLIDLYERS